SLAGGIGPRGESAALRSRCVALVHEPRQEERGGAHHARPARRARPRRHREGHAPRGAARVPGGRLGAARFLEALQEHRHLLARGEERLEARGRIHGIHGIMARHAPAHAAARVSTPGRSSMLRMLRIAAAALFAFAFAAAAAKDREVSIGLQAAITSIDPHYHNLSPNNSLLLNICEPLINRDPDGKLVAALAVSWQALHDLTWECALREGARV